MASIFSKILASLSGCKRPAITITSTGCAGRWTASILVAIPNRPPYTIFIATRDVSGIPRAVRQAIASVAKPA